MAAWNDSHVVTEYAGGAIAKHLRVKYTGDHIVNLAGVADRGVGTAFAPAFNANDPIPVLLGNKTGTMKMVANVAFAVGDDVYTAANGRVGPAATGAFLIGKARSVTTAAGQIVEVLPVEPLGAASP
jgi:hypothetical protein